MLYGTTWKVVSHNFWKTEGGKHSLRVGYEMSFYAKELNMDQSLLRKIGTFHDVGKDLLDQSILYAPRRLTPEEKKYVAKHAFFGYELLRKQEFEVRIGALRHHAAMPQDPMFVQVLRMVDAADALFSKRSYKDKLTERDVRSILRLEHCNVLDSKAVEIFWTHFEQIKELF